MIFTYHQVMPAASSYLYAVSTELLAEHLRIITALEAPKAAHITLDDGHVTQWRHGVPLLQQYGCSATFFVTVGWIGVQKEYFSWENVRQLHAMGYSIGVHGWSHKFLTQCTAKELDVELTRAKLLVQDQLGTAVDQLSFPGGRHNRSVLDACAEAGYRAVYTSDPWTNYGRAGLRVCGRMVVTRAMRAQDLAGAMRRHSEPVSSRILRYTKRSAKAVLGERYYYRLWCALANSPRLEGFDYQPCATPGETPELAAEPATLGPARGNSLKAVAS